MDALIFADRQGNELLPLTKSMPVPLLPVGDKPLIEHTLDDLAAAEVTSAMLVVGSDGNAVRESLGDGHRWNMRIEYLEAVPGESPTRLAKRFAARLPGKFLALRGDVYRSPSIPAFRRAANDILASQVFGKINGRSAQLCLCRNKDTELDALAWRSDRPTSSAVANWRSVDLGNGGFSRLADITDFYLTNVDDLDIKLAVLNRSAGLAERRFFAGDAVEMNVASIGDGPVLLGARCVIKPGTQLHGPVVVGEDAYIDAGAFLHACVVLPGTYVPAGARLRNAVVTSEMAFRMDGTLLRRFGDE